MEIVVVGLIFALGVALLVGPRVARRRRRAPVNVSGWTGATANARRRAAPGTGYFVPVAGAVDDDLWDDDLGWVDPPAHASADDAGPPPPRTRAAEPEPRAGDGTRTPAVPAAAAASIASVAANAPPAPLPTPSGFRFTPVPDGGRLALKARRAGDSALAPDSLVAAPIEAAPPAPDSLAAATTEPPPLAPDSLAAATTEPPPLAPAASGTSPQGDTATPADWSDAEPDWSTGVDVPPPRIARGATAFGAGVSPSATARTSRRSFAGRHPVLVVAAYATAGIALVVIGASYVSSDSFRSSGASAGQRTAAVTPTATVARTPARTPDAAKLAAVKAASRAHTAWLRDRRSAARQEERAVARARSQARAKARQKAAARRRRRAPASQTSAPATVASPPAPTPTPAPAPVHRSPPPCEFCIG